ncbi:MAG TPA: permease-like cell division protein FtsX [Actinokineospora sp.]|nr:permease-like cell division protein FtsX [Actinokineospora sp.]
MRPALLALACLTLVACEPSSGSSAPGPAAGADECRTHPEQVVVYLDTDAEMQATETALRSDQRVAATKTETKQQAYERFKVIFKGKPELASARQEALPASVWIGVTPGVERTEFAEELRAKFPKADEVKADPCAIELNRNSPAQTPINDCGSYPEQVVVYLDTDAEMQATETALRSDQRVAATKTETKQQAYERFKVIFKDQPDLVKLARPEALPASVWIDVAPGVKRTELAEELRTRFPKAQEVQADACRTESAVTSPTPTS